MAKRRGTTERPPDLPGPETLPNPPVDPQTPGGNDPAGPKPPDPGAPGNPPAAAPPENYVQDDDRHVIIRWHPGTPARGGSHTQIHTGDGYSFQITIFWNARGEIESFVIVNTRPGGPDIHIKRQHGEKIQYIVKRGSMIVVKTSRRLITYDGTRHADRETPI
jgi:hypothetical protein